MESDYRILKCMYGNAKGHQSKIILNKNKVGGKLSGVLVVFYDLIGRWSHGSHHFIKIQ